MKSFAHFASVQQVDSGTLVCAAGSYGDAMYLIASGRAQVSLVAEDKKIIVGTLGQGDTSGEISLLDGGRRTATVETLEPSELLSIMREDGGLSAKTITGSIKLLAALAARLRMTDELIADTLAVNLPKAGEGAVKAG